MSVEDRSSRAEHYIGVAVDGPRKTFDGRVFVEPDEYEQLVEAAALLWATSQRDTFRLVIWSQRGFEDAVARARVMAQTGPSVLAWPDYDEMSVTLLDWLLSVRLFLDHTRYELTSRFGSESPQAVAFKAATNAEHAAHSAYRLMYDLRDYCTHLGMPPVGLNTLTHATSPSRFDLTLDPQVLLRWGNWKARTKADLKQTAEPIDACELVAEAMSCLHRLVLVRRRLLEADQTARAERLVAAVERLGDADGIPVLVRMVFSGDSIRELSPTPIPVSLARRVLEAQA